MEGYFLSQRNYTLLYEIVKTGLYKRWNYDISTDRENKFLEKMRTVMKQIYNDRSRFNIDETKPTAVVVKELNKYTLDFIIPHFGEIIQYNISVRGKREETPPQAVLQLAPQAPSNLQRDFSSGLQSTHARMSERSASSRMGNENVMSNYQRLNSERDSILKPHVPKPIDFTLPTGDKTDPSDRYLKMQTQRDNEIDRFKHIRETNTGDVLPAVPAPRNDTITLTNSGIEGYSNMNTANIAADNFNNMVEEKKELIEVLKVHLKNLRLNVKNCFNKPQN